MSNIHDRLMALCSLQDDITHLNEQEHNFVVLNSIREKQVERQALVAAIADEYEELLVACEMLVDSLMADGSGHAFDSLALWAAREKANTAIAKARGD